MKTRNYDVDVHVHGYGYGQDSDSDTDKGMDMDVDTVLDLVSQVRDVVIIRCIFGSGKPGGSGFWNEGYMGKGREMGRSVYKQPGTKVDRILSQQGGFQVSKGK